MSLRGYWRTLSERMACNPAIRITRLTTIARTGRLINRSVNFILTVLGFRSRIVSGLDLVVHLDCGAVAQLEHARRHHFIAGVQARNDSYLVSARAIHLHKLLPYS